MQKTLVSNLRSNTSIKQDTSVLEILHIRTTLKMFFETVLSVLGGDGQDVGGVW